MDGPGAYICLTRWVHSRSASNEDVCTLVLAWQVFEETPIAVVAHREEQTDRRSEPPHRWEGSPAVVAPRDVEAGGTWIGYNERRVFVGITNRWGPVDGEPTGRSRGLLVRDALGEESAEAARDRVRAALAADTYEPFHLVVADEQEATVLVYDGTGRTEPLDPGVHVVVNVGLDGRYDRPPGRPVEGAAQATSADAVLEAIQPRPSEGAAEWTNRCRTLLADHTYGRCIHEDGFGTRSGTVLRLGERGTVEHAPGPPCETGYRVQETPF